jgi:hypothetical protein
MEMKRNDPPGRANRKLRGYLTEIAQLRSEGYTVIGIRKVLDDAGVKVSWATVQREVAKLNQTPAAVTTSIPTVTRNTPAPDVRSESTSVLPTKQKLPTQAEIEHFFNTHVSNPLLRRHLKP